MLSPHESSSPVTNKHRSPYMKICIAYYLFIFLPIASFSQTFELQDSESRVEFQVRNFGLMVKGGMKGLMGQFVLDEDSIERSHFYASVRCETVDTGIALRDRHLLKDEYFNTKQYPVVAIASKKIKRVNERWLAVADVTIKDVTRQVMIPFTIERTAGGAVFKGGFSIDRRDFNVGGNSLTLDDTVEVKLVISGSLVK